MASKLQQYFVDIVNLQRKVDFLKESLINDSDFIALANLRDNYIKWLYLIREGKGLEKFVSLFSSNFVITDHMKNGGIGTSDRYFLVKDLLKKEIDSRVEIFTRIETMSSASINKIPKSENKFPIKLPAGTTWGNFIIKFLDNENVLINVIGKKEKLSFIEMGFEDKRNRSKPNSQWVLLRLLSKFSEGLSCDNPEADLKFKKSKERLSNQLKSYFSIDYDPFYPYKETKSYRTKILLIPPTEEEVEVTQNNETQEYFDSLVVDDR